MALDSSMPYRTRTCPVPHFGWREKVSFHMNSSVRIVSKVSSSGHDHQSLDSNRAALLAALSLVGAAAVFSQRKSFACTLPPAPTVSMDSHSQQEGGANMNEDLRREFEHWKTVPYALTVPLRVVGLRGSVPPIWLKDFMRLQGKKMRLGTEFQGSLESIYKHLDSAKATGQVTSRSVMAADVVTIGDSWLGAAISRGLIESIGQAKDLDWFQQLDPKLQRMLMRDGKGRVSSIGNVWAAPYRCGCMVIAFRKDKLKKVGLEGIQDWEDLWRPELRGRVSMIDSSREAVGLVLKSLGASLNARNFDKDVAGGQGAVRDRFLALRKQVRVFDNVNYLKALGAGDVWVAVGWSTDVLPFAKRSSNVGVVVPASGTSLWADLWAVPATTSFQSDKVGGRVRGPSPLVSQWLEYCLQPARTLALQHDAGASPLNFGDDNGEASCTSGPQLDTNLVSGLPPKTILDRCEFLEPLDEEAVAQYHFVLES